VDFLPWTTRVGPILTTAASLAARALDSCRLLRLLAGLHAWLGGGWLCAAPPMALRAAPGQRLENPLPMHESGGGGGGGGGGEGGRQHPWSQPRDDCSRPRVVVRIELWASHGMIAVGLAVIAYTSVIETAVWTTNFDDGPLETAVECYRNFG
jgi:hypothetical protein